MSMDHGAQMQQEDGRKNLMSQHFIWPAQHQIMMSVAQLTCLKAGLLYIIENGQGVEAWTHCKHFNQLQCSCKLTWGSC